MGVIQRDRDGIIETVLHWDEHTETLHVERTQDVEPMLDRIKAMRAAGFDGYNHDRSVRAIAEVPVAILEQWRKDGVDVMNPDHNKEVMKRLNDPALRDLRLDTNTAHSGIIIKGDR